MSDPLADLYEISRNINARVNDRIQREPSSMSAEANETHWLIVLREELDFAEAEADDSNDVMPNTYASGYDQGWADAIRVIVEATLACPTHVTVVWAQS